jgi:hypothetical protein
MAGVGVAEPAVEAQAKVCGKVPMAVESLLRTSRTCVLFQLAFQPSPFKVKDPSLKSTSQFTLAPDVISVQVELSWLNCNLQPSAPPLSVPAVQETENDFDPVDCDKTRFVGAVGPGDGVGVGVDDGITSPYSLEETVVCKLIFVCWEVLAVLFFKAITIVTRGWKIETC